MFLNICQVTHMLLSGIYWLVTNGGYIITKNDLNFIGIQLFEKEVRNRSFKTLWFILLQRYKRQRCCKLI